MPNTPFSLQEPDPANRLRRAIWFGMRCQFTRAALEGALSSSGLITPVAIVLPASPQTSAQGWPDPPFDLWARSQGIEVIELHKGDRDAWNPVIERILTLRPDIGVGACFPYNVPRRVRHAFPLSVVNIHPSLLPRLRGPEPGYHAYRLGLDTTGVSLHLMDDGWDTGPVLSQQAVPVPDDADARDFEASLAQSGGAMLAEAILGWQTGAIAPRPQDESDASWAPAPAGDDLLIPARLTVRQVVRMVNAVGNAFGQLVVLDTQAGTLVPITGVSADQTGKTGQQWQHRDVVELSCADGVMRFNRSRAGDGRA